MVFIPQAQPHAQSLFLFPIVFGINSTSEQTNGCVDNRKCATDPALPTHTNATDVELGVCDVRAQLSAQFVFSDSWWTNVNNAAETTFSRQKIPPK